MIGALGEILGAVAVVASLVYLGASVRSSARQSRDLAARSVLHQITRTAELLATDAALISAWKRGHRGLDQLDDDDRLRLSAIFLMMMRPYEELFYYRRDRAIDPWAWESAVAVLHQSMGTPGFHQWWQVRGSWFSTSFRAYVDEIIARGTPDNRDFLSQYDQFLGVQEQTESNTSDEST